MLAYTVRDGNTVQIEVDIDVNGAPILPYNSTVVAPPAADAGHYVALVDSNWVQIPVAVPFYEVSYLVQMKVEAISKYSAWYYNQPVAYDGATFQTDNESKNLFIQAYNVFKINGYLPRAWITADNSQYAITAESQLTGIIAAVAGAFSVKFYEVQTLKAMARAATTEAEVDAIVVPSIPDRF